MTDNAKNQTGRSQRCLTISDFAGASVNTETNSMLSCDWGNSWGIAVNRKNGLEVA